MISVRVALMAVALGAMSGSAWAQPAAESAAPVSIRFEGVVGDQPFACGTTYPGLGMTKSAVRVSDFRFYVSALRLVRADGTEVPVTLAQDGLWQHEDVALVDFEDATGACMNGTPETRHVVEGTAPAGAYTGVRFEMGLPFDKNHQEPTLQPSPLNVSRMFWNWNGGYKFLRLDIRSTGQPQGWMVHLGSTGCTPGGSATTVPTECKHGNRVTVDLPSFSVARDVIQFDMAALLAGANVDAFTEKTARGCMSGPADPDCAPLFDALGLAFGDAPASTQRVFRVRPSSTMARGEQR
ncbi:MAG: metallo-mystery pair system four-Cys motif protein [Vicinamibacterales bacterium]|nr:metallo-mystery pair system four-Cys motif protein [Vicinamibacterales bacterium]